MSLLVLVLSWGSMGLEAAAAVVGTSGGVGWGQAPVLLQELRLTSNLGRRGTEA